MSVPSKSAGAAVKPRILCLHGSHQSASAFYNKIAGARRKLSREYELDFLDGPVEVEQQEQPGDRAGSPDDTPVLRAWWQRDENGRHVNVKETFEYVQHKINGRRYDAIIGFSQGGTLATALCLSGVMPGVKAVVTAGAPLVDDPFVVAAAIACTCSNSVGASEQGRGLEIPKLHIAGERDNIVSVERTRALCERGGEGEVVIHEQGHLFPTRAAVVNRVIEFLGNALKDG